MEGETSGVAPPLLLPSEFPPLPSPMKPPPLSTSPTLLPTNPLPSSSQQPQPTVFPALTSPSKASLWSELFTRASAARNSFPAPSMSADGTPIVKAPPSILLKSSDTWKDHIVCYFFGVPPSHRKIFSDLNPIWGKKGDIQIRRHSARACLIFIPHSQTREWVLNVGFWSAGTVAFSTTLWSPTANLSHRVLTSAPVWLSLHDVPPPLWSAEGFELIASGVGEPLPAPRSPPPNTSGSPRVRALVSLQNGPLPTSVIVEDDAGNQVQIGISYPNFPPLCPTCSSYSHRAHRCPLGPKSPQTTGLEIQPDLDPPQPTIPAARSPASPPSSTSTASPAAHDVTVPPITNQGPSVSSPKPKLFCPTPTPKPKLFCPSPSPLPSPNSSVPLPSPNSSVLAHPQGPSPLSPTSPAQGPLPLLPPPGPISTCGHPAPVAPPARCSAKPPPPSLSSAQTSASAPTRPKSSPAESSSITKRTASPRAAEPVSSYPPSGSPPVASAASNYNPPKPIISHLNLLRQLDPTSASSDPSPPTLPGGLAPSPSSGPLPVPPPPQVSHLIHPSDSSSSHKSPSENPIAPAPHQLTLRRSNSSPALSALFQDLDVPAPVAASLLPPDKSPDMYIPVADCSQSTSSLSTSSTTIPSDHQADQSQIQEVSSTKKLKKKAKTKNKTKQKKDSKSLHSSPFFPLTKRLL